MKLTKVNRMRIAIGRKKIRDGSKVILYRTPPEQREAYKDEGVSSQIKKRVDNANNLYNVFFVPESLDKIEKSFSKIVRLAQKEITEIDFYEKLKEYSESENPKIKIEGINYKVQGRNRTLDSVMDLHVRERMTDIWQETEYKKAAVFVLKCICSGKDLSEKIREIKSEEIKNFFLASKECESNKERKPYIAKDTKELEKWFTILLKEMVKSNKRLFYVYKEGKKEDIKGVITEQIEWLKKLNYLEEIKYNFKEKKNKVENTLNLKEYSYEYATEERMNAIMVRMRKSIKRDGNRKVAMVLLQGLARMEQCTLKSAIKSLEAQELIDFIDSVNRDYYKINIFKSLENMDVKVQPQNDTLVLTSTINAKHKGLLQTLEEYASSKEQSDGILLKIKRLLLEYFIPKEALKEKYYNVNNLWMLPGFNECFFDADFKPYGTGTEDTMGFDLKSICDMDKKTVKEKKARRRINYVNNGKYLQAMYTAKERNDFESYWISYIKEYVEKHYGMGKNRGRQKRRLALEDCYAWNMMSACWKDIIGFLCGKYIDLGKAVYHFAMPDCVKPKEGRVYGLLKPEYKSGISSFMYEGIKAEETLQRNIAIATVSAVHNFSNSVVDRTKYEQYKEKKEKEAKQEEKKADVKIEDILFLKENELSEIMKDNVVNQLLRYFGGTSNVKEEYRLSWKNDEFVKELLSAIKNIRNENFHYAEAAERENPYECTPILWNSDKEAYIKRIHDKYYSNNVAMFYIKENICELVEKLYNSNSNKISEAQIPAFTTIWKRKQLPEDIQRMGVEMLWSDATKKSEKVDIIFQGTLYFLLKEIYYRDFILSEKIATYFFKAVKEHKDEIDKIKDKDVNGRTRKENKKLWYGADSFAKYVGVLKEESKFNVLTFGKICQNIMTEYNQQNQKETDEEVYKHYKVLLSVCLKKAFETYLLENYPFLKKTSYNHTLEGEQNYLENVSIKCIESPSEERKKEWYTWYLFAHFIHPRQLNALIGDMKNYIQYKEDILKRCGYAGQWENENEKENEKRKVEEKVKNIKGILQVLEFVRPISGRVSNEIGDYYIKDVNDKNDNKSKEEYAKYMAQYIEIEQREDKTTFESLQYFCKHTVKDGYIDIYTDEENAKLLRNVEISRMYAGGDIALKGYKKITPDEIRTYYKKKDLIPHILKDGLCESKEEQEEVLGFQQLKNRITLHEVTDIYMLINDMLGQLVSLSYLRERDEMYLLLGFYYMAMRTEKKWEGEVLRSLEMENGKYHVADGLILYQVISLFDFSVKLLCKDRKGKWTEQSGNKFAYFINNHRTSFECALRMFEKIQYTESISSIRAYVDHFKYYADHKKSIMELYSEYFTKLFGYNTRLRNSVLENFQKTLERYFVNSKLKMRLDEKAGSVFQCELSSMEFTYKLKDKNSINLKAKNDTFIEELVKVLEYRE